MLSRKRWVGVVALCLVGVVPEAHAQIVAPTGTQPAAKLPAGLSAQGAAGQVQPAGAAQALLAAQALSAAGHRAAVANAAARTLRQGGAARVASTATSRAQAVGALPASAGVLGAQAQAQALTRATRLETMSGAVSAGNAAARAMAGGFGVASTAATAAATGSPAASTSESTKGTTSGTSAGTATASPFAALSPHASWSLRAFSLPQRVATQVAAAGVNPALVIRHPAQNFGSGYLASYASRWRLTSSARGFRAAAAGPNGCLVIGDSIGAQTSGELDALARQEFGRRCAYEVWNGRPTEGAVNALARIAATHGLPRRVVMISGANDIFNPPAFRAQVERAAAIVGPKRTLTWASVFVRRPLTGTAAADLENSRWLNILLSRVVARHDNIRVVNWYGFLAARQRRLSSYLLDGVHPTPDGRQALARLIADRW